MFPNESFQKASVIGVLANHSVARLIKMSSLVFTVSVAC